MRNSNGTGIRRVLSIRRFATLLALTAVLSGGMLTQSESAEAAHCRALWTVTNHATGTVQYCYEGRQWLNNDLFYDYYHTFNFTGSLSGNLMLIYKYSYPHRTWVKTCSANNGGFGWRTVSCPI